MCFKVFHVLLISSRTGWPASGNCFVSMVAYVKIVLCFLFRLAVVLMVKLTVLQYLCQPTLDWLHCQWLWCECVAYLWFIIIVCVCTCVCVCVSVCVHACMCVCATACLCVCLGRRGFGGGTHGSKLVCIWDNSASQYKCMGYYRNNYTSVWDTIGTTN